MDQDGTWAVDEPAAETAASDPGIVAADDDDAAAEQHRGDPVDPDDGQEALIDTVLAGDEPDTPFE